jgi:hypothetical protein
MLSILSTLSRRESRSTGPDFSIFALPPGRGGISAFLPELAANSTVFGEIHYKNRARIVASNGLFRHIIEVSAILNSENIRQSIVLPAGGINDE